MRRVLALAVLCSRTATALPASATEQIEKAPSEARDPRMTSGPALSGGLGSQYPFIGVQVAYYLQLPEVPLRATPYASVGSAICSGCVGAAFGVMGTWGREHRLLIDAFYGTVGSSWYSLHGEPRHESVDWGIGLSAGYEQLMQNGFFWRVAAGARYAFGPPIFPAKARIGPALSLGIGYKFF